MLVHPLGTHISTASSTDCSLTSGSGEVTGRPNTPLQISHISLRRAPLLLSQ